MQAASGGASPSSISKQSSVERPSRLEVAGSLEIKKDESCTGDESDVDVRKVPEMGGRPSSSCAVSVKSHSGGSFLRKRSAAPAEKENKRIKRLLRNRVSAQQARERKKAYMLELETKTKDLEQRNAELEERVSTLQRENQMLRQIVRNTTMKNNTAATPGGSAMET